MGEQRARDSGASARTAVARSHVLVRDSKRLLLFIAEHRLRNTRSADDSRRVDRLRREVDWAEALCRKASAGTRRTIGSTQLLINYVRLIATATAAVDRLSRVAPSLPSERRYDTAVEVQMLDELIEQWGEASTDAAA